MNRLDVLVPYLCLALWPAALLDPAAVLQPDPLDAPAETSVAEAARAAAMAAEMHHMSHGAYKHVDADRVPPTSPVDRRASASAPAPPPAGQDSHSHHEHAPAAQPSPSPSPTPRPSPPPEEDQP